MVIFWKVHALLVASSFTEDGIERGNISQGSLVGGKTVE